MALLTAPFPSSNQNIMQAALAQSQGDLMQAAQLQAQNSQFAQKLDMAAQEAGRQEASKAISDAFGGLAEAKLNKAKMELQRETNASNLEINYLKLAMQEKQNEANMAYKEQSLDALNADREARQQISQQNADASTLRAETTAAGTTTDADVISKNAAQFTEATPAEVQAITNEPPTTVAPNPIIPPVADGTPINPPAGGLADTTLATPDLTVTPPPASGQAAATDQAVSPLIEKSLKTLTEDQMAQVSAWVGSLSGEPTEAEKQRQAVLIGDANGNQSPVYNVILHALGQKKATDTTEKSKLETEAKDIASRKSLLEDKAKLTAAYDATPKEFRDEAAYASWMKSDAVEVSTAIKSVDKRNTQKVDLYALQREESSIRKQLRDLQLDAEANSKRKGFDLEANKQAQAKLTAELNQIVPIIKAEILPSVVGDVNAAIGITAPKATSSIPSWKAALRGGR